jgi:hypothetical protein
MIYQFFAFLHRVRRYREISQSILGIITSQSQARVDKTLTDLYEKSIAAGAKPEEARSFTQAKIDEIHEVLAKENAKRVRQWTEAILEAEEKALSGRNL